MSVERAGGPAAVSLSSIQRSVIACQRCPRLLAYCARVAVEKKRAFRDDDYWGRPVPGFGDPAARLLIVGLAPAAHGGNRTGRVFTGDSSGDFLMRALHAAGFANRPTSLHARDGLELNDAYIAAAVRCAPPDNKPTPAELARCLPWLEAELAALPRVGVIVALGRIAFDAVLRMLADPGLPRRPRPPFGHGLVHDLRAAAGHPRREDGIGRARLALVASYPPSRQNTNTGKLTEEMFERVFATARSLLPG